MKNKKRSINFINIAILIVLIVAGTVVGNSFAKEKVYNWTFVWEQPGQVNYPMGDEYAQILKKASNGRLNVTHQAMGSIVPATQELDAVNKGVIEMAFEPCAWSMSQVPTASLFSGAVGGLTDAGMKAWYYSGGGKELIDEAYKKGFPNITVLGAPGHVLGEVWGYSKKPIESIEDIKGLRMRCMGDAG